MAVKEIKEKSIYVCTECGYESAKWQGRCPDCGNWNTLVEETRIIGKEKKGAPAMQREASPVMALDTVSADESVRYHTGMEELDRVLGGGIVPGAAILVCGDPGIGKSTVLLQMCRTLDNDLTVLYISGEESPRQIKLRANRLGVNGERVLLTAATDAEQIRETILENKPDIVVVDSIQTLSVAGVSSSPGSVSQVRESALLLIDTCKGQEIPLFIVGHVNKDGNIAGPKVLEHMVDTVISLEGDRRQMFRLLRVFKNRFGPNEELLVFRMGGRGMEVVDDPSTFFLGDRDASLSGTAVVMAVDGQRPLAVEVQALVARTFLSIPRRAALGFDANRLHLLLAVLEKRLKLNFGQVDIYAKVGGGMKLQEPGLDLALVAAVLSSYYDVPLPEKCVLWGEVDLNGQVRPVAAHDLRLAQARRLGFEPVIHPGKGGIATIADLQQKLFHRKQ